MCYQPGLIRVILLNIEFISPSADNWRPTKSNSIENIGQCLAGKKCAANCRLAKTVFLLKEAGMKRRIIKSVLYEGYLLCSLNIGQQSIIKIDCSNDTATQREKKLPTETRIVISRPLQHERIHNRINSTGFIADGQRVYNLSMFLSFVWIFCSAF